ncbi:MAG TPA: O-antigen ligase family protein, partial [Candidatus Eisenbacteria bacterium]|nr:O-antigen ligase family protein [Candidatus Eisenbacteria bacterium]
ALGLFLLAAELAILSVGFLVGRPLYGSAIALGCAYFLLAFRSPDLAWALVWLVFPFSIEVVFGGGSAINLPTEPMIAIALAAWTLRSVAAGNSRLPASPLHPPLAVLAGVALVSVALSPHRIDGLKAWVVAAAYAAFGYLYLLCNPCDPARRRRWIRLVVLTGALWGLYGSIRVFLIGAGPRLAYGIARPFFPEHGTYSAYLAMILPLALLCALERRGRDRVGYAAAAFAIALGITLSFTRAAWVSLVVVIPATAMLWAWWRGAWRKLLIPTAVAWLIAMVVFAVGATRSVSRHAESVVEVENVSNLERLNRWMAALEMAKDRPWSGVGYGAYPKAYSEYRRKLIVTEFSNQYMGPHSEPLRLLAEVGVPGLLAALWFLGAALGTGLRVFRRSRDPDRRFLSLAVVAGLATYAVHGLFNSYLGYDKVTVPFWIGLGMIAALGRSEAAEADAAPGA